MWYFLEARLWCRGGGRVSVERSGKGAGVEESSLKKRTSEISLNGFLIVFSCTKFIDFFGFCFSKVFVLKTFVELSFV